MCLDCNGVVVLDNGFRAIVGITVMRIAIVVGACRSTFVPITTDPLGSTSCAPTLALWIDVVLVAAPRTVGIVWTVLRTAFLTCVVARFVTRLWDDNFVFATSIADDFLLDSFDVKQGGSL